MKRILQKGQFSLDELLHQVHSLVVPV